VSIAGTQYCAAPARLYFREAKQYAGLPTGGAICVDQRFHPTSPVVVGINAEAHKAIETCNALHHITTSLWRYYKLVNVQPQPSTRAIRSNMTPAPGSAR
jgi:hypothetical protein